MTHVAIQEIASVSLPLYDAIPSRFLVESVLQVTPIDNGLGGLCLVEQRLQSAYAKDYNPGGVDKPSTWPSQFPNTPWGFFVATQDDRVVGGAAVALDASLFPMDRFQRRDLAVLWDIRVTPESRGHGIATLLFQHCAAWARSRGCGQIGIETQNNNTPACRFYAKQGCRLGAIHQFAYRVHPDVAHETMLLWYLDL